MSRLLVVHHTPSPATQALLEVAADLAAVRELAATLGAHALGLVP